MLLDDQTSLLETNVGGNILTSALVRTQSVGETAQFASQGPNHITVGLDRRPSARKAVTLINGATGEKIWFDGAAEDKLNKMAVQAVASSYNKLFEDSKGQLAKPSIKKSSFA